MLPDSRIMYIEDKSEGVVGPARIVRMTFNKTAKSVYYKGRRYTRIFGGGFKANYYDAETRAHYWISGCKKDGIDALYSTTVRIDEDVREEYWMQIRNRPEMKEVAAFKCKGKYPR